MNKQTLTESRLLWDCHFVTKIPVVTTPVFVWWLIYFDDYYSNMAVKTKTGICAVTTTVVGFLFILIAFCTPCWLENDGKIPNPQFIRIG